MMAPNQDIANDPDLLDLMMADLQQADAIFQPTQYWQHYQNLTLRALHRDGLTGLRGRANVAFSSFGCYEGTLGIDRDELREANLDDNALDRAENVLGLLRAYPRSRLLPLGLNLADLMRGHLADLEREARIHRNNAVSIFEVEDSLIGTPSVFFKVAGKTFTPSFTQAYRAYGQCMRDIDLTSIDCVVEIGSGMGQQADLLHKLHPHLAIILIDIPPQLYVSHQYLKMVHPRDCVEYRDTRTGHLVPEPGKIHFLGNWKIDAPRPKGPTVLWNARSFQEMSQRVVARYYKGFRVYADYLHLRNLRRGLEPEMIQALDLEPAVSRDFYLSHFSSDYDQIADRWAVGLGEVRGYRIMTWKRRP